MTEESRDIDIVRTLLFTYNRGDIERAARLTHPECELRVARYLVDGTVYRGPNALRKMWSDTLESWADPYWEVEQLHAADPHFVVAGTLHVRGRETGVPVKLAGAWHMTTLDSLLYRCTFYTDLDEALAAAGIPASERDAEPARDRLADSGSAHESDR